MKKDKVSGENGSIEQRVFLHQSGAVVSLSGPSPSKAKADPAAPTYSDIDKTGDYQPWGDDNDWPKKARLKVEQSTTAHPLIAKMVGLRYGRGLIYFTERREGDNIVQEFPVIPEIDEFFERNDIQYFMLERLMDYGLTGNLFSEFIMNSESDPKILSVNHLEAEFSRFGKMGVDKWPEDIHYTGDWDDPGKPDKIPFLPKRKLTLENIKKQKKFAVHDCFPSPGRTMYAMPPHGALFRDKGWLDYANSIPLINNNMNDNAMNIKYHIKIPYSYWETTVKDWQIMDQKKRDEVTPDKLKAMDDWLTGSKNAYKSFISHFATDVVTGKKTSGWEIEVIDDKVKKDAYVTSLQEADTQISRAIGMDTSLSGIQANGGKMGAGSGSDKRVGFTNTIAMSYADQLVITRPLYIIKAVNGWDKDVKFGFYHDIPTTLNQNTNGVEQQIS